MSLLFSVVVPVYNAEKYLSKCIDSVLTQTYQNFELILVDDGSTDNSGKICDEYATKDSRIVVVHQMNQGHTMARRKAISVAKGDYFLFLDSDDYWDSNLLETIDDAITASHCDMVIFKYRRITNSGEFISESETLFADKDIFSKENGTPLYQALIRGALNSLCTKAVSAELVDNKDYTYYQNIRYGEDLLQNLPFIFNAHSIIYLDRPMYNYRSNPVSITNNFSPKMFNDMVTVWNVLLEYLIEHDMKNHDNLKLLYHSVYKNMINYEYSLMNASLPLSDKVKLLNEIRLLPLYSNGLQYYNNSMFSLSQKILFSLYKNKHYRLLLGLCRLIHFKQKCQALFLKNTLRNLR